MRRKTCTSCEKRFKNLKLHMRRSNCGKTLPDVKINEPPKETAVIKFNFYGHTEIHMQESNRPRTQY